MIILAIETSCDDTSCAILKIKKEKNFLIIKPLANVVSSQIKIHRRYGGIVPNLAAREHLKNIKIVFEKTIEQTGWQKKEVRKKINLLAVTRGPGLIPSLLIGVNFAKTISWLWKKPIIGVNHLAGHLYSFLLSPEITNSKFTPLDSKHLMVFSLRNSRLFPIVALIISGGHTLLLLMKDWFNFKKIGETKDDAAGECFDKIARLLKLGYPGGPAIAQAAEKWKSQKSSKLSLKLPRPMIDSPDYNFSFSGLKTAVLYLLQKLSHPNKINHFSLPISEKTIKKYQKAIAWEAQEAITDALVAKTIKAAKDYQARTIIISGGVSANKRLREKFSQNLKSEKSKIEFIAPPFIYTTDNALMIALAAFFRYLQEDSQRWNKWNKIESDANLQLTNN